VFDWGILVQFRSGGVNVNLCPKYLDWLLKKPCFIFNYYWQPLSPELNRPWQNTYHFRLVRKLKICGYYNLLVPKKIHFLLVHISLYLAPTYFGWSPSLGTSQPNSLKLSAVKYSSCCYAYECTDYVTDKGKCILVNVHILVLRNCNHSQFTKKIIWIYAYIRSFSHLDYTLEINVHFHEKL